MPRTRTEGERAKAMQPGSQTRLTGAAMWLIVLFFLGHLLSIAQNLLVPLVLALFLWYLVNLLAGLFGRLRLGDWGPPRWLQFLLSGLALLIAINVVVGIIASSVNELMAAAPTYQDNLRRLAEGVLSRFELGEVPAASQLLAEVNLAALIRNVAAGFGSLLGNISLIAVYMLFLFLEQRYFFYKLAAVVPDASSRTRVRHLLAQIDQDVRTYLGVKILVSSVTSLAAWLIMHSVGLDFAAFWALLIFVLNFIPNIGSLIATALPSLLALVQFESLTPFLVIALGVGTIQMLVGNVLEPNLMGRSLNMSPLAIILSLVAWGFLWGVAGMFLCVPIMVVAMIVLYNFDSTRWVALLLSQDGQLKRDLPSGVAESA
jgi:AI-2 transport protein TqsA